MKAHFSGSSSIIQNQRTKMTPIREVQVSLLSPGKNPRCEQLEASIPDRPHHSPGTASFIVDGQARESLGQPRSSIASSRFSRESSSQLRWFHNMSFDLSRHFRSSLRGEQVEMSLFSWLSIFRISLRQQYYDRARAWRSRAARHR